MSSRHGGITFETKISFLFDHFSQRPEEKHCGFFGTWGAQSRRMERNSPHVVLGHGIIILQMFF